MGPIIAKKIPATLLPIVPCFQNSGRQRASILEKVVSVHPNNGWQGCFHSSSFRSGTTPTLATVLFRLDYKNIGPNCYHLYFSYSQNFNLLLKNLHWAYFFIIYPKRHYCFYLPKTTTFRLIVPGRKSRYPQTNSICHWPYFPRGRYLHSNRALVIVTIILKLEIPCVAYTNTTSISKGIFKTSVPMGSFFFQEGLDTIFPCPSILLKKLFFSLMKILISFSVLIQCF